MTHTHLDDATAERFAHVALENIARQYPYKVDHLMVGADDLSAPAVMHPVFYGSYDWHSSVHMHWLLVRVLSLRPALPVSDRIRAALDRQLRPEAIAAELAYFERPASRTFERPYGWGWFLRLQAELRALGARDAQAARWATACAPLADHLAQRLVDYIDIADFPVRTGTHLNSAFALIMALFYAKSDQHLALRKAIVRQAHRWFGHDQRYPARYEPGGDEFLSGGLVEAVLMRHVLDDCSFGDWWEMFSPGEAELAMWLTPVTVADRTDPKMSHLDGLNLSRAWCWRVLGPGLPPVLQPLAIRAWSDHLEASLPQAVEGHYVATHWLATFALLALTDSAVG
ncbi:MAG: DUF2891 domain-containing protein [Burkholderiaceae bacterium]|jgi:Protein of unknown function (DUF2891)|uniref:DUF2891 domain-containing protein n=1 Tax=Cupriavidus metallidurans TaxID=119219 RepID=A0A132H943_9BURK|nr:MULTISPECIES: DUF2891 domain-containing protein [Cupriavidus]PCH57561.1 MAG: DUF2891 domain-containing protein [Burkholderiaceae bacterium]AVA37088.1 DUF2891 domain-containing protein [Cupriavidus metallidurans]KWR75457.1 hypothetical protein RN01_29640 [Cupriavidus sp. SHE]KWW33312.1 hypothetical protein AU374_05405 [Cupriavidus metallidurans]QBP11151.1 DUF2891 domain-containing protein [Cupriavidus metallidurans]